MDILTCLTFATVVLVHDTMLCELINDVVLGIYPTLDMLYLIYDLWHRHSVLTPTLGIYTGTWYIILDTWFTTLDIWHRHLICYTWYLIHDTAHILLYYLCSILPVAYSYLIIPCVFTTWYHLLSLYLLLSVCAHDTIFNACLWVRFIDTRVLSLHAIWHSPYHSLGSFDFPESSCPGLRVWSLWTLPVADQSGTAEAWIIGRPSEALSFQAPCSALEFSCYNSEPPFVLFNLNISLYSRNCAYQWCNSHVILCHIWW